jgi:hypothetical protein
MVRERDRLSKTDTFDVPKREVVSVSRRTLLLGARSATFCVKTGMLTTDADANASSRHERTTRREGHRKFTDAAHLAGGVFATFSAFIAAFFSAFFSASFSARFASFFSASFCSFSAWRCE